MRPARHFPSRDRLSVLTAVIVLAYALSRFLNLPMRAVGATFLGSAIGVEIGGPLLVQVLVAALISTGADTLIRSHPSFAGRRTTLPHWIVPGAAALVLGEALNRLPNGPTWWLGLGLSALTLIAVLIAEYIVVDPDDPAWAVAALALSALTYALALILFTILHNSGVRAAVATPLAGCVAAALAGRLFTLSRAPLRRASLYALLVGLICAETIWAITYWRVTSNGAALMTLLPFYLSVGVSQQHLAGRLTPRVWLEYGLVGLLGLGLILAFIFR
jgi:hypothetical protein